MGVSFDDCRRELVARSNPIGRKEYEEWRKRPGYSDVVAFVHRFEHHYLFEITRAELEEVIAGTEHALGDIRKEEKLAAVEDFTCPFAFQHLFHRYVEEKRSLPTWQDYFRWLKGAARPHYLGLLLDHVGYAEARGTRQQQILARAIQWRLGNSYYSALREVELLVRLREEYGLPVRYHLLADVLLRVDFWLGNTLVCTYFPNRTYRDGQVGRKPPAEKFFRGAETPFKVLHVPVARQGFGNLWRVSDVSVRQIAVALEAQKLPFPG